MHAHIHSLKYRHSTFIYTPIFTFILFSHRHTHTHSCINIHMHACSLTNMHVHTPHAYSHAFTHTYSHTYTCMCPHTHIHMHSAHPCSHKYTLTDTNTVTCTSAQPCSHTYTDSCLYFLCIEATKTNMTCSGHHPDLSPTHRAPRYCGPPGTLGPLLTVQT